MTQLNRVLFCFILAIILLLSGAVLSFADLKKPDASKVQSSLLTGEERAWIEKHPVIRVHNEMSWAPINFNRFGKPAGFSIDVMNLVSEKVGIQVQYISGPSWDEFIGRIKENKLDVMLNIVNSEERRSFLEFTDPYLEFSQGVYTRKGYPRVSSMKDLAGKRFAVPKGFYVEAMLKKYKDVIIVPVKDTAASIQAVSSGQADILMDVMPVVDYLSRKMLITNLVPGGHLGLNEDKVFPLSFGVRKDWPILRNILQKGLASVSETEFFELRKRWFTVSKKEQVNTVNLTFAEQQWLANHPVIRVSSEPDYAPFDFVKDGKPAGFSVDYLNMIAERVGLKLVYIQDTWENLIKKAESKEIDLLHTIFYKPERDAHFLFTQPYKSVVNFIYTRDDGSGIESVDDLANRKVALPKGDAVVELLPQLVPEAKIVFMDRYLDMLKAIALGKVDATIMDGSVATYLIRENTLTNIKPVAEAGIESGDRDPRYRLAVRKDWPELHSILHKAVATISRDDMAKLETRWFGLTKVWRRTSVQLTPEEGDWLEKHRKIRVHNEKGWPPFNYFEYGTPRGLSIDYMNLLAEKLGITVEYVTGPTWKEFLRRLKNKELDVMLNIVKTEDRERYVLYTPPYMRNPNVIAGKSDTPYNSLEQLAGKTVAVPKGFFHQEILKRSFPQIKQIATEDQLAALKAVIFGKADATVGEKAVLEHIIERNLLTGLKISGEIDIGNSDLANLRIGVRNDWPLFQSILTKAMAEVTPRQMRDIQQKWIAGYDADSKRSEEGIGEFSRDYIYPLIGVVVAVGILLLLISWLVSRSRNIEISEIYNSKELKSVGLLIISLSIAIIVLLAAFRLIQFKQEVSKTTRGSLRTVLASTHNTLKIWVAGEKQKLRIIAGDPKVRQLVEGLVRISRNREDLMNSTSLNWIRTFFEDHQSQFGELNYYILSSDMTIIGAYDDRVLGHRLNLKRERKNILDAAFLGSYLMVPPFQSSLMTTRRGASPGEEKPVMLFAGPVLDNAGMVRAIFTISADPTNIFSQIAQSGRLGSSGETYMFDRQGVLLSESRFREELQEIGLIDPNRSGILNIRVVDPGKPLFGNNKDLGDQKSGNLTLMAEQATASINGSHIDGYRDYRGVRVSGAWLWDSDLGLGLATEIDWAEAFSQYVNMRNTLIITLSIAIFIALSLTGFSLWIGQNANRSLLKSKDQLEHRVEERTTELARLEKRFRDLLESAPDSMIIVNDKGVITIVNAQTEKLFGYTRDELIGQEIEFVIPHRFRADHPEKRNGFIQSSLENPKQISRELIGLRKNGEEFPADISLSPLKTDEGLLVSAAVRDVTDRIKAQEALRESEEKNRLVLDNVGEGIFGVNLDGRIMFINPAACDLLGYTSEELLDEKIHDLIHHTKRDGSYYPVDECPMKRAYVEGNTYSIDDEVLWKKDGNHIDVFYTSTPIEKDGRIEGAVITFRDVTEKRLAEEELKASENRFRGYFEYGQVGMSVSHPDKGWQVVNKRFLQMLGYTWEEIESLTWADLTYKDDLAADVENFKKIMAGEIDNYSMDKRFVRKDGELVYVNLSVACTRDETGAVDKLLASMLDITDAKKTETELKRRFDELERFRRLATGRELKMISLKQEINELLQKNGFAGKYKIHQPGDSDERKT